MKFRIFLFALTVLLSITACDNSKKDKSTDQNEETPSHTKWDYTGESGPEHWADLESNSDCSGQHQSPINIIDIQTIPGEMTEGISDIQYEDMTTIESITNNGHTIQYNFNGDLNVIGYKNKQYKMKQFHFHSPSEHTINGVRYPLEIHMVHHSEETNSYIVFAVLVQQGEADPTFTFLGNYLPINEGETKDINKSFDFGSTTSEIFETDSVDLYTYRGSLTTPPCTEDVIWIVMKDASSASVEQIELLQRLMPKNNYRETQPINDRKIYHEIITD
jgi:carbonic anhydrase